MHIALQEVDDQSLSVGMIYLDNYEEALERMGGNNSWNTPVWWDKNNVQ